MQRDDEKKRGTLSLAELAQARDDAASAIGQLLQEAPVRYGRCQDLGTAAGAAVEQLHQAATAWRAAFYKARPWVDCPPCERCNVNVVVPARAAGRPLYEGHTLACPRCGHSWAGTPEDVAWAERAQVAWDKRERAATREDRQAAALRRTRRGLLNLIETGALPHAGWNDAARQLVTEVGAVLREAEAARAPEADDVF